MQTDALSRLAIFEPCIDIENADRISAELVQLINAERAKHNARPLRPNATLDQIADFYACRMIEGGFFGHTDPIDQSTVDTRATDFGYAFWKIGENLARRQRTPSQAMADWMASTDHRSNILDPEFTEVGVSIKIGTGGEAYWVLEFGRSISDSAPEVSSVTTTAPAETTTGALPSATQPVEMFLP